MEKYLLKSNIVNLIFIYKKLTIILNNHQTSIDFQEHHLMINIILCPISYLIIIM